MLRRYFWGQEVRDRLPFVGCWLTWLLSLAMVSSIAFAEGKRTIQIRSMHGDEVPRKALEDAVASFQKENPDIEVRVETVSHENFKANVRKYIQDGENDILTWHSGNRVRVLAERNFLEPLDDTVKNILEFSPVSRTSVTFNNHFYCVPYAYYHWAFYYNKKVFARAGISSPPTSWKEFLDVVTKLKNRGFVPIALGTKDFWPVGGYFDLIGMHSYGYAFHMNLLAGRESFKDARLKKAMKYWAELVAFKPFSSAHRKMDWRDASEQLLHEEAGIMLQGNFWIKENPHVREQDLGSFAFPVFDKDAPAFAIAPTDTLCLLSSSKRKQDAKMFLAYVARADVQSRFANALGMLSPNMKAVVSNNNSFTRFGRQMLESVAGVSQFFDRDADPEVARIGMEMMVDLVDHPENLDKWLARLERARLSLQ